MGNITKQQIGLGLSRGNVNPLTFPLPQLLSAKLRNINEEVNNGRGFVVLRGLTVSEYSEEDVIIVYAGLTSHVASHRAGFIGNDMTGPLHQDDLSLIYMPRQTTYDTREKMRNVEKTLGQLSSRWLW